MKLAKSYRKDVYCLEGPIDKSQMKQSGIHAALLFLKQHRDIDFIYRTCDEQAELIQQIEQWKLRKHDRHSVLYLSFQGRPRQVLINDLPVELEQLADILGEGCENKIIHFGSSQTINTDLRHLKRFLRATNALCVCGFGKELPFTDGSIFDILLLDLLQEYVDISKVDTILRDYYGSLVRRCEFRMEYI